MKNRSPLQSIFTIHQVNKPLVLLNFLLYLESTTVAFEIDCHKITIANVLYNLEKT